MKIGDDERKQIRKFKEAGASVKAIANRFGITEAEVERIIQKEKKAQERAEGLDRFEPAYRIAFKPQWEYATQLVLKGLGRA
jgi:predicted transcriptional regulator